MDKTIYEKMNQLDKIEYLLKSKNDFSINRIDLFVLLTSMLGIGLGFYFKNMIYIYKFFKYGVVYFWIVYIVNYITNILIGYKLDKEFTNRVLSYNNNKKVK